VCAHPEAEQEEDEEETTTAVVAAAATSVARTWNPLIAGTSSQATEASICLSVNYWRY